MRKILIIIFIWSANICFAQNNQNIIVPNFGDEILKVYENKEVKKYLENNGYKILRLEDYDKYFIDGKDAYESDVIIAVNNGIMIQYNNYLNGNLKNASLTISGVRYKDVKTLKDDFINAKYELYYNEFGLLSRLDGYNSMHFSKDIKDEKNIFYTYDIIATTYINEEELFSVLDFHKSEEIEKTINAKTSINEISISNKTVDNEITFNLRGRNAENLPKPIYNSTDQGQVVVKIIVDKNGNVIKAKAGWRGTTNLNLSLWEKVENIALNSKFNKDEKFDIQTGCITYKLIKPTSPDRLSKSNNDFGKGGSGGGDGISFKLGKRKLSSLPKPDYKSDEQGGVVVKIWVDRGGNVIQARAGEQGTTVSDVNLWKQAEEAAKKAKFLPDNDAPEIQTGTITYKFVKDN